MSGWRKFENHKEETKAVKKALVRDYPNIRVGHGTGTAWGWLEIYCNIPRPGTCRCQQENEGRKFPETCEEYQIEWRRVSVDLDKRLREITGRTGEYGGRISYNISFPEKYLKAASN